LLDINRTGKKRRTAEVTKIVDAEMADAETVDAETVDAEIADAETEGSKAEGSDARNFGKNNFLICISHRVSSRESIILVKSH
jgi:hypothetical protein